MDDALAVNVLYYGDNLEILREYVPDESIDLVYLDPPFNSKRDYNVLFGEGDKRDSVAQIRAFEDCWHWDRTARRTYDSLIDPAAESRGVPEKLVALMESLYGFLHRGNDMMAYLVMMAIRLVELHRVLKPSGTLYLHCDPTASHYLKLLLDAVFGHDKFVNEIVWKRTNARSTVGKWPRVHDILLCYSKGDKPRFRPIKVLGDPSKLPHTLITGSDGKKYQTYELTAPGETKEGDSGKPWRGYDPTEIGRHWANGVKKRDRWDVEGLIHWPAPGKRGGFPRRRAKDPFDPSNRMVVVGDVWTDIQRINQSAKERLGYPTQKPVALVERIIEATTDEGDVVLDPFCGCGTTIHAAQRLKREWIGIDITHLAIGLIRNRLDGAFPGLDYEVKGEPVVLAGARELANEDPYQFQWWALAKIGAHPVSGGPKKGKKGRDQGIDGIIRFKDHPQAKITERIIISVKAGRNLNPGMIRDLRGTIEREKTPIGVFLTMHPPTSNMRSEAAKAGVWNPEGWDRGYNKIQILTIEDVLKGKKVDYPGVKGEGGVDVTLKKAPKDAPPTLPGIDVASTTRRRK